MNNNYPKIINTSISETIENLPGEHYTSQDVFKKEIKDIFEKTWQFVGLASDIKNPGDYITVTIANNMNVILIRNQDSKIKCFYNVCPHRGAKLLENKGSCKKILCPYHAWAFTQDGELDNVPNKNFYFPTSNLSNITLQELTLDIWEGMIFVKQNSSNSLSLKDYLADFPDFLSNYKEKYSDLNKVAAFTFREKVNWKIIVENYVEDYHFSVVHPGTLKVFDFKKVKTLPTGAHCRIYMPYKTNEPKGPCKYLWQKDGGSCQGFIFPTMTVQTAVNHVSFFRIIPLSAEETIIEIPVYQTLKQMEQYPLSSDELEKNIFNDMEEDFVICRSLQTNLKSPVYKISALAGEHELGIKHFQNVWSSYMGFI